MILFHVGMHLKRRSVSRATLRAKETSLKCLNIHSTRTKMALMFHHYPSSPVVVGWVVGQRCVDTNGGHHTLEFSFPCQTAKSPDTSSTLNSKTAIGNIPLTSRVSVVLREPHGLSGEARRVVRRPVLVCVAAPLVRGTAVQRERSTRRRYALRGTCKIQWRRTLSSE